MGVLVKSLESMDAHWRFGKKKIYSVLLAKDLDYFKDISFVDFIEFIHLNIGKGNACYFFAPHDWKFSNVNKKFDIYNVYYSPEAGDFKRAIISGTREFEQRFKEELGNANVKVPSITKKGETIIFGDLGLLFFNKESGIGNPKKCLYVPISKQNWERQLQFIFKNPNKNLKNFDVFINYLNKNNEKILKFFKEVSKPHKWEIISTGINIVGLLLAVFAML
ncbi:hypothetical protein LCGC14_1648020 [marine sediment metagenome]|uniref:Uncharacterized protein n=1 Tax=marine sediment metagenome TaxID=412755 RepID=A0A0F9KXP6_9ZZZZ